MKKYWKNEKKKLEKVGIMCAMLAMWHTVVRIYLQGIISVVSAHTYAPHLGKRVRTIPFNNLAFPK